MKHLNDQCRARLLSAKIREIRGCFLPTREVTTDLADRDRYRSDLKGQTLIREDPRDPWLIFAYREETIALADLGLDQHCCCLFIPGDQEFGQGENHGSRGSGGWDRFRGN